jgi:glycerophosphoryl diester phosphodiesterase
VSWPGARQAPLLFAHRGASLEHPESSLAAFAKALELGADVLEIDVQMTADGHVVVSHDADGARSAGVPRAIGDCTLSEVKRWNIGQGAHLLCPPGQVARMPTFDDVLDAFPHARLNVDLKREDAAMLDAVLALIDRHAAHARVLLTSFSSRVTGALHARGYRGPIGLGRDEVVRAVFVPRLLLARFPLRGTRMQVPVNYGPIRLDRAALIDKLHKLGIPVDYWVVNDVDTARRLLALGADGIVTDDPRSLAPLFAKKDAPKNG